MFTRQVTFIDFNNKPHVEMLYFHMMTPELADLEFNPTFEDGLSAYIKTAMTKGEGRKIYTFFKMLVINSYGRRSEDGSEFVKKAEWTEQFLNSRAWEQFFLWLTEDPKNAEAFWNGVFPEALQDKVDALEASATGGKRLQDLSQAELVVLMQKQLEAKKVAEA